MTRARRQPDLARIGELAFTEVLNTFLSLPATPLLSSAQALNPAPDQLAASILLTGKELSGTVKVVLPLPFVAQAIKQLTGLDGAEQETIQEDAAGEIANMVAGRVAAQLASGGYACTLGMPSVSRNASSVANTQPIVCRARTDLLCNGHRLSLVIHCRYNAEE